MPMLSETKTDFWAWLESGASGEGVGLGTRSWRPLRVSWVSEHVWQEPEMTSK